MSTNQEETKTMTNEDRLGANIRQAKAINRSVLIVAALIVALLVGWNLPVPQAHAAPLPTLDYDTGENPRDIGDWPAGKTITVDSRYAHKRWPVAKVVNQLRARGVPVKAGTCPPIVYFANGEPDYRSTAPCITISSDRHDDTGPTGRRLGEVSLWSQRSAATGNRWLLDAADISLDDRDGKRASAKKRERKLRSYILQAAGR